MNTESQTLGRARLSQRAGWASAQSRGALGTDAPYRWRLRFAVLAAMLSAVSLWACSVPVFRYALEKWAPDTYQATVFHRGPLSAAQEALARDLTRDGLVGRLHANISLQTVDLAETPAPELLELWQQSGTQTLPWLVVRYPQASRLPGQILSGPLAEATLKQVFDSPARKEIARRLGQGDSAVWVLLEFGDRQRNDDTTKLVETRLNYLATVLKLPAIEAQDVAAGLVTVPEGGLKLAFSLLRVSRTDAAEETFVKMLLGSEADLGAIREPMLFPVFGRGRALYALAGKGINHETIDEAATFLIGKCSCQVKELNPGVDLLLAADWDRLVNAQSSAGRGLPTLPTLVEAAPEVVTITGRTEPASPVSNGLPAARSPLAVVLGFTLAGLLAVVVWLRKN